MSPVRFISSCHHQGSESPDIFLDDKDRNDFLFRLEKGLSVTGCRCYAWVLMSSHVHLLIRTHNRPLGDLMRKVLTGHAISFNRRYRRTLLRHSIPSIVRLHLLLRLRSTNVARKGEWSSSGLLLFQLFRHPLRLQGIVCI